jgi:hypothetical protein
VNVPKASPAAVVDSAAGKQSTRWSFNDARDNFAMALDENEGRVIVVFRKPALIVAFGAKDGQVIFKGETCGDADDVFVDPKRPRVYVSCGAGLIDVLERRGVGYERVAQVPTAPGARTSLFVPNTDRLYVGVRASSAEPAAVWVFRPAPMPQTPDGLRMQRLKQNNAKRRINGAGRDPPRRWEVGFDRLVDQNTTTGKRSSRIRARSMVAAGQVAKGVGEAVL